MKEQFKSMLVACAAISTFGIGAYTGVGVINSYIDSRVTTVTQSSSDSGSGDQTAAGQASVKDLAASVLKKLLR